VSLDRTSFGASFGVADDDFPTKPTLSQKGDGKRRVFTPQKQHEDGRATEGYLYIGMARFFIRRLGLC
jgi:hypothetical protein